MELDKRLRIAGINKESIVDGDGLRYVIYEQGCNHNCLGCHNPETHDFKGGKLITIKKLIKDISENKCLDGVTLSGGDPFFQADKNIILMKEIKNLGLNIWVYTGFRIEEFELFMKDISKADKRISNKMIEMLKLTDKLVDGRFEIENKSMTCRFRGSTNQRIIDIKDRMKEW